MEINPSAAQGNDATERRFWYASLKGDPVKRLLAVTSPILPRHTALCPGRHGTRQFSHRCNAATGLGVSQEGVSAMMSKLRQTGLLPEEPAMENAEEQTVQSEAEERERREAEEANEREIEAQRNVFLSGGAESCARGSKNCGQNWSGSRERAKVDAADGSKWMNWIGKSSRRFRRRLCARI